MRRAALVLVLTGCGGFLPFFGDDDDEVPSPPAATDGGAEAGASSADGGTSIGDAARAGDAAPDAGSAPDLTWRCLDSLAIGPYDLEDECNAARLGRSCNALEDTPIGLPCATLNEVQTFCKTPCQKTPSAATYEFTTATCNCQP